MKNTALAAMAGIVLGVCSFPAVAQQGPPPSQGRQGYPPQGSSMAPYGRPSGPMMQSRPGSPYGSSQPGTRYGSSQQVPSTRFGSIPESHRSMSPSMQNPPGARMQGGPPSYIQRSYGATPPDTSSMQQALRQRDYERLGNESRGVRSRADEIQNMGPDLPVQERLKLPLIKSMYRQGADMVDEGRSARDESKIRMGIQQINEANEKLGRIESQQGGKSQNGDRNGRNNGNSRREHR